MWQPLINHGIRVVISMYGTNAAYQAPLCLHDSHLHKVLARLDVVPLELEAGLGGLVNLKLIKNLLCCRSCDHNTCAPVDNKFLYYTEFDSETKQVSKAV